MLWQDCGSKFTSVEVRCGRQVSNTSVAKREAEKWPFGPSGVKTPEGNADFMSCLKARPTNLETFSATCEAATHEPSIPLIRHVAKHPSLARAARSWPVRAHARGGSRTAARGESRAGEFAARDGGVSA